MAGTQKFIMYGGGRTVAASTTGQSEMMVAEMTVSALLINEFPKLNVSTNRITTAKATKSILSPAVSVGKIPTLKSLKLSISRRTKGEHKITFSSSTVLVMDQTAGLGQ